MHSPSPSAAPILVFIWCYGQVIKGAESTEREWLSARLSPGLSQCRLRPMPGEGKGGRGVYVARDHAISCSGSHGWFIAFPMPSDLTLEPQSCFCFKIVFALSSLLLPGSHSRQKAQKQQRDLLSVTLLAADLLTCPKDLRGSFFWLKATVIRWDYFIALPFVSSIWDSVLLQQILFSVRFMLNAGWGPTRWIKMWSSQAW